MIDCVWPAETILGEAPYWCPEESVLYWVDIDGKSIFRFDPESGDRDIFPQEYEFGCIAKRAKGGFIGGTNKGIALLANDMTSVEIVSNPEPNLLENRFNDGKCDRRGRFWAGTADVNEIDPTGSLYCVEESLIVDRHFSNIIVANGLGWSPDNRTMYFTDSGLQIIHAFDYDNYLKNKSCKTKTSHIVFIDEDIISHSDYIQLGIKAPISCDAYFPKMLMFFDDVEKISGLEVIIAAHPRSSYKDSIKPFGNRQVIAQYQLSH